MTVLTLVTDIARTNPLAQGLEAWAESISTLSGGAHSVQIYYPGELVAAFESFDAVTSAQVDMAFLSPVYYTPQLPGALAPALPFQAVAGGTGSANLFTALTSATIENDFDVYGLSVLAAAYDAPRILYTAEPVSDPSDLSGNKLTGAPLSDAFGFTPVSIAAAEIFAALLTGVIDGAFQSPGIIPGLEDVAPNQLALPGNTGFLTFYETLVINDDVAASLPSDLSALLASSTGLGLSASLGEAALDAYSQGLDLLGAGPGNLTVLSGGDLEAVRQLAEAVTDALILQSTFNGMSQAQQWLDAIALAEGTDVPTGTPGQDTLIGSDSDDTIGGAGGSDSMSGGTGNDMLSGGIGFDTIDGGSGNDTIIGQDGYDSLLGGAGDDSMIGNNGFDFVDGGSGRDSLYGGLGLDTLLGSEGDDFLSGQAGFDHLDGGTDNDTLQGNAGADTLLGGLGDDSLNGGINDDNLDGGDGNDMLNGNNGSDSLTGGAGDDILQGNAGSDTLDGGTGNDILRGGIGADTFVFTIGSGADIVIDFQNVIDVIALDLALMTQASPVPDDLRGLSTLNADGNLILDFGNGDTLTFNNITNTSAILDEVIFF